MLMDEGFARLKARVITNALDFDDPEAIDIEAIAMLRGIVCVTEAIAGAEGRLIRGSRGGVIRVKNQTGSEGRRRFTVAHEIGHYELHQRKGRSLCTAADLYHWGGAGKEEEYQANVFAAELLMPERLFAPRCRSVRPSLDHISAVANVFRTSLTSTAIRFVELCREECVIILSRDGRICWGYPGREFRFKYFSVGSTLSPFTIAYDYFHGKPDDRMQQSVDASAWFPNIKFRQDAMLKEQSWRLGEFGGVLTLIWIDQEI
jgi:hypothetical protein